MEPRESTDDQRQAMLRAIHEREGTWDEVDPDTEVARMGNEIGLRWVPLSLPPSGGPTQVGTTPRVGFQATIGLEGEVKVRVAH